MDNYNISECIAEFLKQRTNMKLLSSNGNASTALSLSELPAMLVKNTEQSRINCYDQVLIRNTLSLSVYDISQHGCLKNMEIICSSLDESSSFLDDESIFSVKIEKTITSMLKLKSVWRSKATVHVITDTRS